MLVRLIKCSLCLAISAFVLLAQPMGFAQTDRDALISLYNATGGDSWSDKSGWKMAPTLEDGFNDDPCSMPFWHGVICAENSVTQLALSANQLRGEIPAELGNFPNLTVLRLSDNQLTGKILPELSNLSNLKSLDLRDNQLTGAIPEEVGNLVNLETPDLYNNQLTGETPAELGSLSNLKFLSLFDNQLTGAIPRELGNLSNLIDLSLNGNQLTGLIPSEFSSLAQLTFLNLSANQLTGVIPEELGNLSNLTDLALSANQLTGVIPEELGNPPNLAYLSLALNQLTGSIPLELGNLFQLQTLHLSENQLSEEIPSELGNLSNLIYLILDTNQLTGEIPEELGNLANLSDENGIALCNNQLYTDSNTLRDFLNSKSDGSWEDCQTLFSYFAQFGDGEGLSSQIVLFNLNDQAAATGEIQILDDFGDQLSVDLNGEMVNGVGDVSVPAGGLLILRSDGEGDLQTGSVQITTDRHVEGVVIFGGEMGLAGVGSSAQFTTGFTAPMLKSDNQGLNTGIAIMSLSGQDSLLDLTLLDSEGVTLATASGIFMARGHDAFFVDEMWWEPMVYLSEFAGTLVMTSEQPLTGTVLQTLPGEFMTMPVASSQTGQQQLYFAHFADGLGLLSSQILLLNLSGDETATAQIQLRDDTGAALTVDLNGEQITGLTQVQIAASGLQVLATDGVGDLVVGSVSVTSDQPLAGVIVFKGEGIGSAGVGSSAELAEGFLAPMETNISTAIRTGVAMMNLEEEQLTLTADLLDSDGTLLDSVQLSLASLGHLAIFLDEFDWDNSIDLNLFEGLLRVRSNGRISATVIQTRPGQFATMPVAAKPLD